MERSLLDDPEAREALKTLEELKGIIGGIAPDDQKMMEGLIEVVVKSILETLDEGMSRSVLKGFLEEGLLPSFEMMYCAGGLRGIWKQGEEESAGPPCLNPRCHGKKMVKEKSADPGKYIWRCPNCKYFIRV